MARPNSSEGQTTMRHLLHEMRTPLGQIIGYGEMLEEELEDRGQGDLIPDAQRIQGAARKLLGLLEDEGPRPDQPLAQEHGLGRQLRGASLQPVSSGCRDARAIPCASWAVCASCVPSCSPAVMDACLPSNALL